MDKIKICLKTQKNEVIDLKINRITENEKILTITLDGVYDNISLSDIVCFSRIILDNDNNNNIVVDKYNARILSKTVINNNSVITLNAPDDHTIQPSNITKFGNYLRIDCVNTHNIFPQDLQEINNNNLSLYYYDKLTNISGEICKLGDVRLNELQSYFEYDIVEPKYCLFNIEYVESYNCDNNPSIFELRPNFYYYKNGVVKNTFYILKSEIDVNMYKGICLPYNLFYYRVGEHCILWDDFNEYRDVAATIRTISGCSTEFINTYKDNVYTNVLFYDENNEYKINVGLSQEIDYKHLYQQQNITEIFGKKIKEKVMEDNPVIDMEKVKFAPYLKNNTSASGIVFNLHFRTRTDLNESWRYDENSEWYWNPDYCKNGSTYEENGIINYGDIPNHVNMNEGHVNGSDMLYYLGFTDEDVQNQKNKIKKSFIRLSFYDDINPLTQKLLYYSTVFFDGGDLFGKYVKAKSDLRNSGITSNIILNSYKTKYRVDSKIIVRDEFYTQKSSEGFNIYFFPDEVIATENVGKTIYMKVEFNHAGYGRTIPMFACGNVQEMSLNKYLNKLYIKLKLKYVDGKFIYCVDEQNSCIIEKDATIEFNLFEPIIDIA